MKTNSAIVLISLFCFYGGSANGSIELLVSEEPAKSSRDSANGFSFSGYFDTYYFANLNHPSDRTNLGSSGVSRGFDRYPGQFQLGMLLTQMKYSAERASLAAEIGYGPNVEYGSYGNDFRYKWGTVLANNTMSAILIKQAYIDFRATEKLTLTMGQFGTHIGYEYIDAPLNFHYSINNTFNSGIPFYHTGIKATYRFHEQVSLMAGVVNGTDNLNDNNRGKSFIGQLSVTASDRLNFSINTIQGNEANARNNGQDTTSYFGVIDFVMNYKLSHKLMIGIWAMEGSLRGQYQGGMFDPKMRHWQGLNLYTAYHVSKVFSIGSRIEYFDNRNGARALLTNGHGTDVMTYTFTGNIILAKGKLTLKPELRTDKFHKVSVTPGDETNVQQFVDSKGNFSRSSQTTIGMAAIFKF